MKNLKIPDSVHTELKVFSATQDIDNMGYWAMGFIMEGLKIRKHKFVTPNHANNYKLKTSNTTKK